MDVSYAAAWVGKLCRNADGATFFEFALTSHQGNALAVSKRVLLIGIAKYPSGENYPPLEFDFAKCRSLAQHV